jgi:transposase
MSPRHISRVCLRDEVISQSVKKTNKNDAELLALYLGERIIAGGAYERTQPKRDESSGSDTRSAGQIALRLEGEDQQPAFGRGDQAEAGSVVQQQGAGAGAGMPLSPMMLAEALMAGQIRGVNQSIAELEDLIEEEGPKLAGHRNLMSIKGIGPVSAAVLLSVIGNIRDFSDPGKLAAYLGLVPRVQ